MLLFLWFVGRNHRFVSVKGAHCLLVVVAGTLTPQAHTARSTGPRPAGAFVVATGPWLLKMFPDLLDRKLKVARTGHGMIGVPAERARDYSAA